MYDRFARPAAIACAALALLACPGAPAARAPAPAPEIAASTDVDSVSVVRSLAASRTAERACVEALPLSAFRPALAQLTALAPRRSDSLPTWALPSIDLTVETVAVYARARLGAPPGAVPYADTTQNAASIARMFEGHVHVVGRRDGTVRWWAESDSTPPRSAADSVARQGELLIGAALDSAVRAGEAFQWPDERRRNDSLEFALHVVFPIPLKDGTVRRPDVRHAAPLIVVHVPWTEPARPKQMAKFNFPTRAQENRVRGTLVMQFMVDTAGRVVPGSIRDLWPADRPRPVGVLQQGYVAFKREVERGLRASTFHPARIGGCAVSQLVQQPFTFAYPQ